MFLRCTRRKKDGKEHHYWNVVENRRVSGGRVVQRQVLYLGEINDSQREAWRKTIEVFEDGASAPRTMALFPEDRAVELTLNSAVDGRKKAQRCGGGGMRLRHLACSKEAAYDLFRMKPVPKEVRFIICM